MVLCLCIFERLTKYRFLLVKAIDSGHVATQQEIGLFLLLLIATPDLQQMVLQCL